jgi:hypothetical protein
MEEDEIHRKTKLRTGWKRMRYIERQNYRQDGRG